MPYISVIFTNRNDNYGGDLKTRIDKFIDYYAYLCGQDADLFEFVICDWNPPAERPLLEDAFDWGKLPHVKHVVVPNEIHNEFAGTLKTPMFDYIGRNVAIRHASSPFCLVMNQDIFVTQSIFDTLRKRSLKSNCFYRADRVDFDFASIADTTVSDIETNALASSFEIHRRHSLSYDEISVPFAVSSAVEIASAMEPGDKLDEENDIIECCAAEEMKKQYHQRLLGQTVHGQAVNGDTFYYAFYLHTNASGDFILAPRAAFDDIRGLPERTDFYMHSDSYAVFQLFSAGYQLCIFKYPHVAFHADHDRSARANRNEAMTYKEHERAFSRIIRGDDPAYMNGEHWGLKDRLLDPAPRVREFIYE